MADVRFEHWHSVRIPSVPVLRGATGAASEPGPCCLEGGGAAACDRGSASGSEGGKELGRAGGSGRSPLATPLPPLRLSSHSNVDADNVLGTVLPLAVVELNNEGSTTDVSS